VDRLLFNHDAVFIMDKNQIIYGSFVAVFLVVIEVF